MRTPRRRNHTHNGSVDKGAECPRPDVVCGRAAPDVNRGYGESGGAQGGPARGGGVWGAHRPPPTGDVGEEVHGGGGRWARYWRERTPVFFPSC